MSETMAHFGTFFQRPLDSIDRKSKVSFFYSYLVSREDNIANLLAFTEVTMSLNNLILVKNIYLVCITVLSIWQEFMTKFPFLCLDLIKMVTTLK